ncbi:hypothetical protein [Paraburkholderia tropica]|uniref:hypothetical protein n=1 Tax=Paraburkholderia tropica TaxID=92647 RepID=UPI002ABE5C5A|nr:hypothetical protein [Paraburkholderia tropica]
MKEWLDGLSGLKLTHAVQLVSGMHSGVASTIAAALKSKHVKVERWTVTRCRGLLDQLVIVAGITEGQAVSLREEPASIEGVLRVKVVHQLVRDQTEAEGKPRSDTVLVGMKGAITQECAQDAANAF